MLETFSLNGSALGDPGASWGGRLLGGIAGVRTQLSNTASALGGEQNKAMAEAGKKPLTPEQAKAGADAKAASGGKESAVGKFDITVNNQLRDEGVQGRDVQAAALQLIGSRALAEARPADASPLTAALQKFTTMLELDCVFEGMAWPDVERAAGIIAADLASTDPTRGRAMHDHAVGARRGADGIPWVDPQRAADALQDAAMICPRMFG